LFRVHCAVLKVRAGCRPGFVASPAGEGGAVRRGLVPTEGGSRDRAAPSGLNSVPRTRYRPDLVPAASSCTRRSARRGNQLVNVPPLSSIREANALGMGLGTRSEDLAPGAP